MCFSLLRAKSRAKPKNRCTSFGSASDYPDVGIVKGSLLAVDRALTPQHGNIIIISVNDELVMRRLLLLPSSALQELNGDGTLTPVAADQDMPVWGVVSYAVTDLGLNHWPQE
ncbi:hypothetical protein E1N66_05370 [Pantoea allii]|nr:hypothetical protein [Pantoea allii]THB85388.1 hypothetical protein E1N66_05370 [Pantoea allii]